MAAYDASALLAPLLALCYATLLFYVDRMGAVVNQLACPLSTSLVQRATQSAQGKTLGGDMCSSGGTRLSRGFVTIACNAMPRGHILPWLTELRSLRADGFHGLLVDCKDYATPSGWRPKACQSC